MSLGIQCDNVKRVLLADGWHKVYKDSFGLDSYEFLWGERVMHAGGNSNISATGFVFNEDLKGQCSNPISGPLSSILAVQYEIGK